MFSYQRNLSHTDFCKKKNSCVPFPVFQECLKLITSSSL
uniref:Uncharacterized protein n=1 Tax=Anguilla anguilla TaxID=7936 RepID=A0A0E9XGX6_ANGAN